MARRSTWQSFVAFWSAVAQGGLGENPGDDQKFSSMSKRLAIDLPEGTPPAPSAELRAKSSTGLLTCSSFVGRVVALATPAAPHDTKRASVTKVKTACGGTFRRSRPRPRPRCIAHASPTPPPAPVVRGSPGSARSKRYHCIVRVSGAFFN